MTAGTARDTAPRRQSRFRRKALPYLPQPAGTSDVHRHPHSVLHCGLLFATAVPDEPSCHEGIHLVRQLHQLLHRPEFWNTVYISLVYAFLTVGLELLLGLGIALFAAASKPPQQSGIHPAPAAVDDGPGTGCAYVEAHDPP